MKVVNSDFIISKGFKHGNTYYITNNENKDESFNVYQIFSDINNDTEVKDIKMILPNLKKLPNDEIIVSIPEEKNKAFLLLYHASIYGMNKFRLTLEKEEILSYKLI